MTELLMRLQDIIDAIAGGRIANFARITGIKDGTVRNWFNRKSDIQGELITQICLKTGFNAHWLLTGEGPRLSKDLADPDVKELEDRLGAVMFGRGSSKLSPEFVEVAKRELARLLGDRGKEIE